MYELQNIDLGDITISVKNALTAPVWIKGRNTAADWATIKNNPAPWAEIGSDKFILTLPSKYIRSISDPAAIADFYDTAMDNFADITGVSCLPAMAL